MKIIGYRYLPLNIFLLYTIFVFSALFFGPVKYKNFDYYSVVIFVFLFVALFALSFIYGVKGKAFNQRPISNFDNNKIVSFFLYLSLLIAIKLWLTFFISGKSISISSIGSNYVDSYEGYTRGQASIGVLYIYNIFEQAIVSICLLFYFSHYNALSRKKKMIGFFICFSYIIVMVLGSGKQKYLGDVVILLSYTYLISMAVKKANFSIKKILLFSLSFVIVLVLFSYILSSRYSAIGVDGESIINAIHPLMHWDSNSPVILIFGDVVGFPLGMFLGYFSNGLYGLSLSLNMPFEWTYFLGSSYSLAKIVEAALGANEIILQHSYPFRAEEIGWGLDKWHSAFAWFASDITFLGVLVLGAFFGYAYGKFWKLSIININPISRPIFLYLSIGIVFIYSNNQLFHALSGVIVFFTLFVLHFLYARMHRNRL